MAEILSIGEALIDFLSVEKGVLIESADAFTAAPGGAPANVAAAASKLGGDAGFIGKVGKDSFGRMIRNALTGAGVDCQMLFVDEQVNTSLAFIAVKPDGEPDFTFFRNRCGADLALRREEIDERQVRGARVLHYGSISFTGEPLKSATLWAMEVAKASGSVLSYDPNLRPSLWDNLGRARAQIMNGMRYADIVKMTAEELAFISETAGALSVREITNRCGKILGYGPKAVVVTRGAESCVYCEEGMALEVPAFKVAPVDTTGGGDAFVGGLLVKLCARVKAGERIHRMGKEQTAQIVRFAHACGALTVTRKGVIPALPTLTEVEEFLVKRNGS